MLSEILEFFATRLLEHEALLLSFGRRLTRQFLRQHALERRIRYLESRLPN